MRRALIALALLAGVARGEEDLGRWTPTEEAAREAHARLEGLPELAEARQGMAQEKLDALLPRLSLPGLVSLVAAPAQGPAGNDRRLAAELLVRAGDKARPYLARALSPDAPSEPTRLLLETAERTGDEGGKLEAALLARAKKLLADGKKIAPLCRSLGVLGGRTAFAFVAATLLDARHASESGALGTAGAAILERDKAPDELLSPLLDRIKKLEEARLKDAFLLLGRSKGAAVAAIDELVTRLDRDKTDAADKPSPDVDSCLANGLAALVQVGTKDAFSALAKVIERTRSDAHRRRAIVASMQARAGTKLDAADALANLVGTLHAEESTLQEALVALTGDVARDAAGWRRVIDKQRAALKP